MADSDITVSGLVATPGIGHIALQYVVADPHVTGLLNLSLDAVEIYAASTNNRNAATKVAEGNKTNALHVALVEGATYYYWVRARNQQGYYGDWYPASDSGGLQATVSFASDFTLIGGLLVASVSAGALTIALKLPDGTTDPSAGHPVRIVFFEQYGGTTTVAIVAALSITIPSGAELGTKGSSVGNRLYAVMLKSGSSAVIGVINCLVVTSTVLSIIALNDKYNYSPTEDIAGAANDLAGSIFTTGGGYSQTPMRIVASFTWEGTIVTPGTWVAPSSSEMFGKQSRVPGQEIQRSDYRIISMSTKVFGGGGATALPIDDTLPTYAEGSFFTDRQLVPQSTANVLEFVFDATVAAPAASQYVALMVGPTNAAAEAIDVKYSEGANIPIPLRLRHQRRANSVTTSSFEFRFGYSAAGTITVNGASGARLFGGGMGAYCAMIERQG